MKQENTSEAALALDSARAWLHTALYGPPAGALKATQKATALLKQHKKLVAGKPTIFCNDPYVLCWWFLLVISLSGLATGFALGWFTQ